MRSLAFVLFVLFGFLNGCGDEDGSPICEVVPAAVDFGDVFYAGPAFPRSETKEIRVRNTGTADLTVAVVFRVPTGANDPQFHLDSTTPGPMFVVPPGDSTVILVALTGDSNSSEGEFIGTVDLGVPCGAVALSANVTVGE